MKNFFLWNQVMDTSPLIQSMTKVPQGYHVPLHPKRGPREEGVYAVLVASHSHVQHVDCTLAISFSNPSCINSYVISLSQMA